MDEFPSQSADTAPMSTNQGASQRKDCGYGRASKRLKTDGVAIADVRGGGKDLEEGEEDSDSSSDVDLTADNRAQHVAGREVRNDNRIIFDTVQYTNIL